MWVHDKVHNKHVALWYSLFKQTNGRFTSSPCTIGDFVYIDFNISNTDFSKLTQQFEYLTTLIVNECETNHINRYKRKFVKYRNNIKRWLFVK